MAVISNKTIWNSLLGKLPPGEEDDFLAVCFSSDENARKYEFAREDLIESRLRGDLSAADRQQFDDYFLKDNYHQELYEFAKKLRDQMADNRSLQAAVKEQIARKPSALSGLLIPVGGFAALVLAVLGIWFFASRNSPEIAGKMTPTPTPAQTISPTPKTDLTPVSNSNITQPVPSPAISPAPTVQENPKASPSPAASEKPVSKSSINPIMAFALLMTSKGESENILKISKEKKQVNFEAARPYESFPGYQLLITKDGKNVSSSDYSELPLNQKKLVSFGVPAEKLADGQYEFVMIGKNKDGSTKTLEGTRRSFTVENQK